MDLILHFCQ